ncbi:hypothetical protein J1605_019115 [Eschrichtius robustus]|uniref:Uncharacterized protein n=1 Tax=Eschrichtius robustus TaxID=9764 RepID=A0AB34HS17_ESCRO|nr:hypothetical protein J1605_019115 [Eschrichtius robustus]
MRKATDNRLVNLHLRASYTYLSPSFYFRLCWLWAPRPTPSQDEWGETPGAVKASTALEKNRSQALLGLRAPAAAAQTPSSDFRESRPQGFGLSLSLQPLGSF